jgi:hypothetical protein
MVDEQVLRERQLSPDTNSLKFDVRADRVLVEEGHVTFGLMQRG